MAGLMLTAAIPVANLDHPSICVHHEGNLVVGVFERTRTPSYDLIYIVGRLDKAWDRERMSIKWGSDTFYSKGCAPSIALIRIGEEYWVVETHQSEVFKTCYYGVGKVNVDALTIDFKDGSTHIGRGLKPKICATDDRTVILVSEKALSRNGIQYYRGEVNVHAKSIEWHEDSMEFSALSGTSPSISVNEEGYVVVACVCGSNLNFIAGDLRLRQELNQGIAWGAVGTYGKGTNPSISINFRGRVVEAHQKGFFRTAYTSTGEYNKKNTSIVWNNNCFQYTLGRSPSISLADDGYVIESHKTNFGYQTFLSHGKSRGPDRPAERLANVPERQADLADVPEREVDVPDAQLNVPDGQVEEIEIEEQGQ